MLTITQAQVERMRRDLDRRFARRLAAILVARRNPEAPAAQTEAQEEALLPEVEKGLERAAALGLTEDRAAADFVALRLEFGEAFERHPLVREAIETPRIPQSARLPSLLRRLDAPGIEDIRSFCRRAAGTSVPAAAPRPASED